MIARARRGDSAALGELYGRYLRLIFRYLHSRLGNRQDAEDLTETTFLRAFRALPNYRERGWPFSAYLYRTARNVLTDHYRSQRPNVGLEWATELAEESPGPAESAEHRQDLEDVQRALRSLPEDYQEAIRLRIVLGMSVPETAKWFGRSEGATRLLVFRALRRLREKLGRRRSRDEGS